MHPLDSKFCSFLQVVSVTSNIIILMNVIKFMSCVVTHFWVPVKNKINSQKSLEKITEGRSAQETVRKLVKKFKNTRIKFLTVYS